jgi:small-conductance mechanosensitive channel
MLQTASSTDAAGSGLAERVLSHNPLIEFLANFTGLSEDVTGKIFLSILIVLGLPLLSGLILRVIRSQARDDSLVYRTRVVLRYFTGIADIILLIAIWFGNLQSLGTYISIVSAGLVIALQDSVANMAGFVFIMWRRPFVLQDRIEIDGIAGDVIDIRLFQFTLVEIGKWVDADQSTGRIVHIPNRKIFSDAIANYTAGWHYIWNEIPVVVTYESDWRKAKKLLEEIAAEHCEKFTPEAEVQIKKAAQRYMIISGKLTPIVYTRVIDIGVELTLRYLTPARSRRGTTQAMWESILDVYAQNPDIDFAYPTVRYFDNRTEGKPGAGGPQSGEQ